MNDTLSSQYDSQPMSLRDRKKRLTQTIIEETALRLFQQQKASFLLRYQVVIQIPSLASIYLYALMKTEPALGEALCSHQEAVTNRHEMRFLVALYMAALRVALEEWLEQEAQGDLVSLLGGYLDSFSSLSYHA